MRRPPTSLERRGLPEFQRVGRLNVVMVVQKQRVIALLAIDSRWSFVDPEQPRLEPGADEQLLNERGRRLERPPFRRNARFPAQNLEQPKRILLDPLKISSRRPQSDVVRKLEAPSVDWIEIVTSLIPVK